MTEHQVEKGYHLRGRQRQPGRVRGGEASLQHSRTQEVENSRRTIVSRRISASHILEFLNSRILEYSAPTPLTAPMPPPASSPLPPTVQSESPPAVVPFAGPASGLKRSDHLLLSTVAE